MPHQDGGHPTAGSKEEGMMNIVRAGVLFLVMVSLVIGGHRTAAAGDRDLNSYLKQLNIEAQTDLKGYTVQLGAHFGVNEHEVDIMIRKVDRPADAYMVFRLAKLSNKPLDSVYREYEANRGRGWGVLAKNLGIKPGSPEFHALKKGDFYMGTEKGKGKDKGKSKGKNKGQGKGNGHGKGDD